MTKPAYAATTDDVRWYTLPDGTQLPSVTSVLKVMAKPALTPWAARRGVEATVAWVEARSEAAYRAGQPLLLPTLCERAHLADEHTRLTEKASVLGDAVHDAIEGRILGRPAPLGGYPKAIAGHMRGFEDFLDTVKPTFTATESTVVDRKRGYAGTLDARAVIGGKRVIVDWKSGTAVRELASLQLAGYRYAPTVLDRHGESDAEEAEGGMVLRIRPRSWQLHPVDTSELALRGLLFARGLWAWNQNVAPGAIEPPIYRNS